VILPKQGGVDTLKSNVAGIDERVDGPTTIKTGSTRARSSDHMVLGFNHTQDRKATQIIPRTITDILDIVAISLAALVLLTGLFVLGSMR
jgi:hypothetical protein